MNKVDIAKKIVDDLYAEIHCGIFSTRNNAGDPMMTVYDKDGLTIDVCSAYGYFEVFGLSEEEFDELEKFYNSLEDEYEWDYESGWHKKNAVVE